MQSILSDLKKDGFINIQYPESVRKSVEGTSVAWKKFCTAETTVKESFHYSEVAEAGYEFKGVVGVGKDLKENFHMTPKSISNLEGIAAKTGNQDATNFIISGKKLFEDTYEFVKDVLLKIEEESGIVGLAERGLRLQGDWIIRFLHYLPGMPVGNEIAATHPDKGSVTLHLYESDGGLQYFWDGVWKDMPVSSEYTASIGGMGLQYATECQVKATNHRVIATENTSKEGRYSIVMFIPVADVPEYDKERYGRTQDVILKEGVGFNYNLTFPEFKEYFKQN